MPSLTDGFGRRFRYLRLSVTEVCNYRCTYCLPDGYRKSGPASFLDVAEIRRLCEAFAGLGVGKVDAPHADGIETQFVRPLSDPRNKALAIHERPDHPIRCDISPF